MTESEELLNVKKHIHGHIRAWGANSIFRNDTLNAIDMAIQALEKQIAKKPNEMKTTNKLATGYFGCPVCEEVVGVHDMKDSYCHNCGQKINWKCI